MGSSAFKFNILLLFLIFYVIIAILSLNNFLFIGYSIIIFLYGIYNFKLSLVAWLLIVGFYNIHDIVTTHIYTFVLIIVYLFNFLKSKEKYIKNKFIYLIFILFFLGFISSYLFYQDHILSGFIFLIYSLVAFIISQQLLRNRSNIFYIGNSLIISGLIMSVYSIYSVNKIIAYETVRRVGIGDNVRSLSNVLGISIVSLIVCYFFEKKYLFKNNDLFIQNKFIDKFKYIIILVLSFSLISTVSRGVLISISVFILSSILVLSFKDIKTFISNFLKVSISFFIIVILFKYFNTSNFIFNMFNVNEDVLLGRFNDNNVSDGSSIRENIWKAGFDGLDSYNLIIGNGFSSFKFLAKQNGFDFYSHSVFMDILISTGFLGFLSFIFFLLNQMKYAIFYSRSKTFIPLLFFLILNYFSHGDMNSYGFWILLGIIIGLNNIEIILKEK